MRCAGVAKHLRTACFWVEIGTFFIVKSLFTGKKLTVSDSGKTAKKTADPRCSILWGMSVLSVLSAFILHTQLKISVIIYINKYIYIYNKIFLESTGQKVMSKKTLTILTILIIPYKNK